MEGDSKKYKNRALAPGRDKKEAIEYFTKLSELAKTDEEKAILSFALEEVQKDEVVLSIKPRDTEFALNNLSQDERFQFQVDK